MLSGDGVHHDQPLGKDGVPANFIENSKPVQHASSIRRQLQAGADLGELLGLFEDVGPLTGARYGERGGESTDAAAHNQ